MALVFKNLEIYGIPITLVLCIVVFLNGFWHCLHNCTLGGPSLTTSETFLYPQKVPSRFGWIEEQTLRELSYLKLEICLVLCSFYTRENVNLSGSSFILILGDPSLTTYETFLYPQKVPSRFRWVVEQTLREFFKSIQLGKDLDPSWKKQIYKVIARLDDYVPDYFKTQTFLDQLE